MKQVHHSSCEWAENGHMFLHQGADVLINSVDITINEPHLQTISNTKVPACSVVTIPTVRSGTSQAHHVFKRHKLTRC